MEMDYMIAYECALDKVRQVSNDNTILRESIASLSQENQHLRLEIQELQAKYTHVCSTCNRDHIQES